MQLIYRQNKSVLKERVWCAMDNVKREECIILLYILAGSGLILFLCDCIQKCYWWKEDGGCELNGEFRILNSLRLKVLLLVFFCFVLLVFVLLFSTFVHICSFTFLLFLLSSSTHQPLQHGIIIINVEVFNETMDIWSWCWSGMVEGLFFK